MSDSALQYSVSHVLNSLSLAGNSGGLTWVRHSSRKSSATHWYQCVQYFCVSKQWYGRQCLRFLTCVQMLMHAIAHGGCTDTVRQSALEVDSGRTIPCLTGDSNPHQYCVWLFSRTLYQLSYPHTWAISMSWRVFILRELLTRTPDLSGWQRTGPTTLSAKPNAVTM